MVMDQKDKKPAFAVGEPVWVVYPPSLVDINAPVYEYRWIIDGPLTVDIVQKGKEGTATEGSFDYHMEEWEGDRTIPQWLAESQVFKSLSEAVAFRAEIYRNESRDKHHVLQGIRERHLQQMERM